MTLYFFEGFDFYGKIHKGIIHARNIDSAREKLAEKGILVLTFKSLPDLKLTTRERSDLYIELAALLDSGLPVMDALNVLKISFKGSRIEGVISGLIDRINEGESFSVALREVCGNISSFEFTTLEIGEKSGKLSSVLIELADFLDYQEKVISFLKQQLFYPVTVFILGLIAGFFMLIMLLPRISNLLKANQIEIPFFTIFVLNAGKWGSIIILFMILVYWIFHFKINILSRFYNFTERLKENLLYRIPGLKRIFINLWLYRFCNAFSFLIKSGVTMPEAIELAARSTGSIYFECQGRLASSLLRNGVYITEALSVIKYITPEIMAFINIGIRAGNIAWQMERASKLYENRFITLSSRLVTFFGPVLIIIVGVYVLSITLAVLLPILQLTRTI